VIALIAAPVCSIGSNPVCIIEYLTSEYAQAAQGDSSSPKTKVRWLDCRLL